MRTRFPEELADKAWDNTGCKLMLRVGLLACPSKFVFAAVLLDRPPLLAGQAEIAQDAVLLTNDLTSAVVDEAIKQKVSIIVCYRESKCFSTDQQRN
jgi:hypothetical protein